MIAITAQIAAMVAACERITVALQHAHANVIHNRPSIVEGHLREVMAQASALAEAAKSSLNNIPRV